MEDEEELRPPVNDWIRSRGWEPLNEYHICWRIPDVVGIEDGKIRTAVEMKLSDWKTALGQAHVYRFFSEMSYIAMPSCKQRVILRNIRDFNSLGIGVLIVRKDHSVLELLPAGRSEPPFGQI
ncbi:MAG: hypothetical protein ABSB83_04280 [Methanomassiliicoccales archaeon]